MGLLNVQYALKDDVLYVLEANPRASRTVPFVSKATAVPIAKAAARIMLGASIAVAAGRGHCSRPKATAPTCPTTRPSRSRKRSCPSTASARREGKGVDSLLGPEMKSTGEVMGIDTSFGKAFAKSQTASYGSLPTSGRVFVSVANRDKRAMVFPIKRLADLGFKVLATAGTAEVLRRNGIPCTVVRKHFEGPDNIVDMIHAGEVDIIINTPYGNHGPAHRRLRDPHRRGCQGDPVHHDDPGRGSRRARHRSTDPRRHRRAAAAGVAGDPAQGPRLGDGVPGVAPSGAGSPSRGRRISEPQRRATIGRVVARPAAAET